MKTTYIPAPPFGKITIKHLNNIHKLLDENPYRTLEEIGDELGMTRERVRQLINENNKFIMSLKLWEFEPDYYEQLDHFGLKLITRLKPRRKGFVAKTCPDCNKEIQKRVNKCMECYTRDNTLNFVCTLCKKKITISGTKASARRNYSKEKRKHPENIFCSRRCASTYSGIMYGFGKSRKRAVNDSDR